MLVSLPSVVHSDVSVTDDETAVSEVQVELSVGVAVVASVIVEGTVPSEEDDCVDSVDISEELGLVDSVVSLFVVDFSSDVESETVVRVAAVDVVDHNVLDADELSSVDDVSIGVAINDSDEKKKAPEM